MSSNPSYNWGNTSDDGKNLNKFKVLVEMEFNIEAHDEGEALRRVERMRIGEKLGNVDEANIYVVKTK